MSRVDEHSDSSEEPESQSSDEESSEKNKSTSVKSDLAYLRSNKSVASKLQIFNHLISKQNPPPSFKGRFQSTPNSRYPSESGAGRISESGGRKKHRAYPATPEDDEINVVVSSTSKSFPHRNVSNSYPSTTTSNKRMSARRVLNKGDEKKKNFQFQTGIMSIDEEPAVSKGKRKSVFSEEKFTTDYSTIDEAVEPPAGQSSQSGQGEESQKMAIDTEGEKTTGGSETTPSNLSSSPQVNTEHPDIVNPSKEKELPDSPENIQEVFKRDNRPQRVFRKKDENEDVKKREFKRSENELGDSSSTVFMMSPEEFDLEKKILSTRVAEFESQRELFLNYIQQEQEKLTQAKYVLEEVATKLDGERKQMSKTQSKLHYDIEAILLEKKQLESQKDILKSIEEERQTYETDITSKNQLIQSLKDELNILKLQMDSSVTSTPSVQKKKNPTSPKVPKMETSATASQIPPSNEKAVKIENRADQQLKEELQISLEALEKEKKENNALKIEVRNSKTENIHLIEQNKELLSTIAKKDRRLMNIEKKLKRKIKEIHNQYDKAFLREREDFCVEKASFVELKLKLSVEEVVPIGDSHWEDPQWLAKERDRLQKEELKTKMVKRFIEEERNQVMSARKKLEAEQSIYTAHKLSLFSIPRVVINLDTEEVSLSPVAENVVGGDQQHPKELIKSGKGKSSKKRIVVKSSTMGRKKGGKKKKTKSTDADTDKNEPKNVQVWGQARPRGDSTVNNSNQIESSGGRQRSGSSSQKDEEKKQKLSQSRTVRGQKKISHDYDDEDDKKLDDEELSIDISDPFNLSGVNPLELSSQNIVQHIEIGESYLNNLRYSNEKELESGHLAALLLQLGYEDPEQDQFTFTLLLTSDYYIDSITLLKSIILLYRAPFSGDEHNSLYNHHLRLIETISVWLSLRFEYLYNNQNWMELFYQFINYLKNDNPVFSDRFSRTFQSFVHLFEENKKKKQELAIKTSPDSAVTIDLLSISPKDLAQQLTLIDQMYFQNINLEEYFHKAWEYNDEKSPNISLFLQKTGETSCWIATEIILARGSNGHPSVRKRARIISRFIRTMKELVLINNFNSVILIFYALKLPIIGVLNKTWEFVPEKDKLLFNKIKELMQSNANYSNYRQILQSISETHCIPFLALLLKDITLIEYQQNILNNDQVNFHKMTALSKIFAHIQDYQGYFYAFDENPHIQAYLLHKTFKPIHELEPLVSELEVSENTEEEADESDTLGDDILAELDQFDMRDEITQIRRKLSQPQFYISFHKWTTENKSEFLTYLECLGVMSQFKKTYDTLQSDHVKKEAYNIISIFLLQGSAKYIDDISDEIVQELVQKLQGENISNDLFDEIIEACCYRLYDTWKIFIDSEH